MKTSIFLIALLFLFSGFSMAGSDADKDQALKAIDGFYDAMTNFSYDKIGNYCTSDFAAIDDAVYYKNLDEFLAILKTYEGAEFTVDMKVEKATMDSKSGLIIMTFNVDIKMGDEKMHITALENYVMKKVKGKWLIQFIHSSPVKK